MRLVNSFSVRDLGMISSVVGTRLKRKKFENSRASNTWL